MMSDGNSGPKIVMKLLKKIIMISHLGHLNGYGDGNSGPMVAIGLVNKATFLQNQGG
jgi:hypothetical protein